MNETRKAWQSHEQFFFFVIKKKFLSFTLHNTISKTEFKQSMTSKKSFFSHPNLLLIEILQFILLVWEIIDLELILLFTTPLQYRDDRRKKFSDDNKLMSCHELTNERAKLCSFVKCMQKFETLRLWDNESKCSRNLSVLKWKTLLVFFWC